MHTKRIGTGLLLALMSAAAVQAQTACPCGSGTVVGTTVAVNTLLAGKTVCAAVGNEAWQEFHGGSSGQAGNLIDYKRGPGDAVDPSASVGTWTVIANAPSSGVADSRGVAGVNYNYSGGGGSYSYTVCQSGSTVNFCGPARNITGATLISGQAACGSAPAATERTRPVAR